MTAGTVTKKKLCDGVETAKGFCYLGDIFHAGGGSEAAVTARTRIGCVKFGEYGEVLRAIRHGIWKRNMVPELRKSYEITKNLENRKSIVKSHVWRLLRAMYGVKLMDRKTLVN